MTGPTLLFLDCETTGPGQPDPTADRVVEVCLRAYPGEEYAELVHPGEGFLPIPEDRTSVHGIETSHVEDLPGFDVHAPQVQALIDGADYLIGYNLRSYDVPLLDAELQRYGFPGIDLGAVREVDLYRVWTEKEPRSLEGAVRRFGADPDGNHEAHSARGDVAVLPVLLRHMVHELDIGGNDLWETLDLMVGLSKPEDEVDRAGRFRREGETVVFAFGKHRGEPASERPDYLRWMLGADFPEETKAVCRRLLETEEVA